jgi:hypothetical protein
MLATENKTVPTIFREFIAKIETFIEKTCIQEISREKLEILPTSTVIPCRSLDFDFDTVDFKITIKNPTTVRSSKITPIPCRDDAESQHYIIHIKPYQQQDTVEYCDMV